MRNSLVLLGALVVCVAGCVHQAPFVWVNQLPLQKADPPPYRIHIGDLLAISVWNQPNLSTEVRVRPDGKATLPLISDIVVEGLTPPACEKVIAEKLHGLVLNPRVTVTVREITPPTVSVVGEVKKAGNYPLHQGDTVLSLLARSGGLTEFADRDQIYVVRHSPRLLRVRFSYQQLSEGLGHSLSFRLHDGDVVVVQ